MNKNLMIVKTVISGRNSWSIALGNGRRVNLRDMGINHDNRFDVERDAHDMLIEITCV
jgi:hypothetical protein